MRARAVGSGDEAPAISESLIWPRDPLERGLRAIAVALILWSLLATITQSGARSVATIFFNTDAVWLVVFALVLLALSVPRRDADRVVRGAAAITRSRWTLPILAATVLLVAMAGWRLVFQSHAFTQDETMALFDAEIFRGGQALARIPEAWRPYADALEPRFILPVADHAAWVSSYLPGNAALHALLDIGPGLASALLAAVAVIAVFGVARRLWPERRDAAIVAALLLATSPQFLFTAATPFAMTAHLACDLVWLWLFLRGGVLGHGGAVAVTVLACGLHQVVFHPLFACPFVLQLWAARRWRLAALYTAAFAAACLGWILYWQLMLGHYGLRGAGSAGHGLASFLNEVVDLVRAFSWDGLDTMAKNVTRFLAWQNPLALALAAIGVVTLRRLEGPLAALAAGLALTLAAMFILLPNQGFGWGYRYLHGLLGSFCLIAASGWIAVTGGAATGAGAKAWSTLGLASLFTVAVVLPSRAIEIEGVVGPYAAAERAIRSTPTELVLVDTDGIAYATALVRNDPLLRNRPLVLDLLGLTPQQVETLCAARSVAMFDARDGEAFDLLRADRVADTPASLKARGCARMHVSRGR